jgi:Fe-S cluster assembly protein SufB
MFIYIFNSVKGMESKNLVMDEYNIKLNYERDRLYGLSKDSIIELSKLKKEPEWMLKLRLKYFEKALSFPKPNWLPVDLDLSNYNIYTKPKIKASNYEELPQSLKEYYDKLGIPESERKFLAGAVSILDSEAIYSKSQEILEKKGIIMMPIEEAIKKYDILKDYFMNVLDSQYQIAALHAATWSGGVFVYVPKGVHLEIPIEGIFVIGSENTIQAEHTIIIADEGSSVTYVEGCFAPRLSTFSIHNGGVEVYVKDNAKVKYITIQNWSSKIINISNKRGITYKNANLHWIEGSLGGYHSFSYPSTILEGENSSSTSMLLTLAGEEGEWKEGGSKMIHRASNTKSKIISKSVSFNGGNASYRGLVKIEKGAKNSKAYVKCDSLVLDEKSRTYTFPHNQVFEDTAEVAHEAYTAKMSIDQLFYLENRGFEEKEALSMLVMGFMDDIIREFPFQYATMLNNLMRLELDKIGALA